MPELPDIVAYIEAISARVIDTELLTIRVYSPFLLRSVSPPISDLVGKKVLGVSRLGKRIVIEFEGDLFLVIHLMIAGRLAWKEEAPTKRPMGRIGLATLEFTSGTLMLTEAGSKKRAALHLFLGKQDLAELDPGGIDVLDTDETTFAETLRQENRTLKRALTNPHWFSGIGNAYSDEILHAARLSPVRQTQSLSDEEVRRLFLATRETLENWIALLREQFGGKFPGQGKITAFREEFAAHGKFGKPCPVCGNPIQRIRYAENETNYCAKCQNEGRLLADRALSRLLKSDWPRTLEEMSGE